MSACNEAPPPGHPFHGSGVACHMPAEHDGPHTWDPDPSPARLGLDRLLSVFRSREVESVDNQRGHAIVVRNTETGEVSVPWPPPASGPWVLVRFVGGDEFAIWKATGAVYRVGPMGAVEDDPILTVAPLDRDAAMAAYVQRRNNRPEQIDNGSLPAGSPMYYYCASCGHLVAVMHEGWWREQPPKVCEPCRVLVERGWMD